MYERHERKTTLDSNQLCRLCTKEGEEERIGTVLCAGIGEQRGDAATAKYSQSSCVTLNESYVSLRESALLPSLLCL